MMANQHIDQDWWRGAVIYQIYPRSFCDANHDGIGDLAGIIDKLEYVASLGVDGIWLSPFFTSPMKDFGYDVSDYRDVDPMFGTLDDFKWLVARAHELGLKLMIDQVLSHTSDQHPWFKESRSSHDNPRANWYVWADPKPDGTPPNNWLSLFGGSAWQWDSRRRQYYLHNFLTSQPDLNFYQAEVQDELLDVARFWLQLGVDGFRLDTANFYFHDSQLRDNPPDGEGARPLGVPEQTPYSMQRHVYDLSRPENLEFLARLRTLLDEFPGSTTVGEIAAADPLVIMAQYTSGNDKLHMAYTFDLLNVYRTPEYIRQVVGKLESRIGDGWPCWALSNHDVARHISRWGNAESDPRAYAKVLLALLTSLRGSVCLYQGEELGLPEADVPYDKLQDPYGIEFWPDYKGRDGCRTPMVWNDGLNGGFSTADPWLPVVDDHLPLAVSVQERQPDSMLHHYRDFLKWRKGNPALVKGDIHFLGEVGELSFVRRVEQQHVLVMINLTDRQQYSPLPELERLVVPTRGHGFSAELEGNRVSLPPYQAFFAELQEKETA